ncbi:hypothetical protein ACFE04_021576 [Oxalis oulophora]
MSSTCRRHVSGDPIGIGSGMSATFVYGEMKKYPLILGDGSMTCRRHFVDSSVYTAAVKQNVDDIMSLETFVPIFLCVPTFVGDMSATRLLELQASILRPRDSVSKLIDGQSFTTNPREQYHPGTRVYVSSRFCGWDSLMSIMHQAKVLGTDLLQVSALHPEGFHVIGYSQGGLLARAMLELYPYHNVHTFISLSSPQAGQYGTRLLRMFFPTLVKEEAYKFLYSKVGQYISVGNFWNDPHHRSLYLKYNKFLPVINNEAFNSSSDRKSGIAKLKKLVLIGGPDDEIIEPWQSSHFAFYNENETVIPLQQRTIYEQDTLGLKKLDEKGRLHMFSVSGVHHHFWHRNETVLKNYILPWLN